MEYQSCGCYSSKTVFPSGIQTSGTMKFSGWFGCLPNHKIKVSGKGLGLRFQLNYLASLQWFNCANGLQNWCKYWLTIMKLQMAI